MARDPVQRHYVQALYYLTKALDPTRPVIDNDGWEHMVSDIYSIHDYAFDGAVLRERYGGRRGSHHCNGSGLDVDAHELLAPRLFHHVIIP